MGLVPNSFSKLIFISYVNNFFMILFEDYTWAIQNTYSIEQILERTAHKSILYCTLIFLQ